MLNSSPPPKNRLARLACAGQAAATSRTGWATASWPPAMLEAALDAWSRVPEKAPEAGLAALASGRLAMDQFHYAVAERWLGAREPRAREKPAMRHDGCSDACTG